MEINLGLPLVFINQYPLTNQHLLELTEQPPYKNGSTKQIQKIKEFDEQG